MVAAVSGGNFRAKRGHSGAMSSPPAVGLDPFCIAFTDWNLDLAASIAASPFTTLHGESQHVNYTNAHEPFVDANDAIS